MELSARSARPPFPTLRDFCVRLDLCAFMEPPLHTSSCWDLILDLSPLVSDCPLLARICPCQPTVVILALTSAGHKRRPDYHQCHYAFCQTRRASGSSDPRSSLGTGEAAVRRWVILGLIVIGSLLLLTVTRSRTPINQPAPDFLLPDLTGQVVRLSQLKGKVILLNVW